MTTESPQQSERLRSMLAQVRLVKDKHDAIAAATGANFNVFSVLGVESRENRHSALLAELLRPNGSHSQGTVFLQGFFDMLGREFQDKFRWNFSEKECAQFTVTTEAGTEDGRIDIFLVNNDIGKCVVIENKIYAGDQERQLGRYYHHAKILVKKDENITVIYLTLRGDKAGGYTRGEELRENKVLCLSYQDHIVQWLEDCIKASVRIPHIRETLLQYQSLVKKLTNQHLSQGAIMDTINILKSGKNYELIPELERSLSKFRQHLQYQFWCELRQQVEEILNIDASEQHLDKQLEIIKGQITNYYEGKGMQKRYNYCLEFTVLPIDDDREIAYSFSIGQFIFHGFRMRDTNSDPIPSPIDGCDDKKYVKYKEATPIKDNFNTWWFGCEFEYDLNFDSLEGGFLPPLMQKMISQESLKREVKRIVKKIPAYIDSFKKNLSENSG